MSVLLAIKPKYADAIYKGDKWFECRKSYPVKHTSQLVFMYETFPVCAITGYFRLLGLCLCDPSYAWEKMAPKLCVDEKAFLNYYKGCDNAYLWKVGWAYRLRSPVPLDYIGVTAAPQSYVYLDDGQHWLLQQFF